MAQTKLNIQMNASLRSSLALPRQEAEDWCFLTKADAVSMSCAHVLHKTLNLVISRCCFAEDGEEMYKNSKRTYRAIVFPH